MYADFLDHTYIYPPSIWTGRPQHIREIE